MKKTALMLLCVLAIPVVGAADLVITEKISGSGFMGMGGSEGTEVTYLKGDMIRSESEMTFTGMMPGMAPGMKAKEPSKTVTIMRFDKGVIWNLDQEHKTYTEIALESGITGEADQDVHFKVNETKVTKTDKKRDVAGYKCEGVNVKMTFEVGSEEEKMIETMDILFWLAPEKKELKEMQGVWKRMVETMGGGKQSFGLKDAMDDLSKIMEDLEGVPLAMDMTMNLPMGGSGEEDAEMKEAMKMMQQMMKGEWEEETGEEAEEAPANQIKISRETVSISEEKVDASLFEIPEGYKEKTSTYGQ
jgi:hypothetical protein